MYQVFDTVDEVSRYTAQRILDKIKATPDAVLGFATGSTMEPVYARLLQCLQQASVDVSQLITFNLDEYIGLSAEHSQSYIHSMCACDHYGYSGYPGSQGNYFSSDWPQQSGHYG